MPDWRSAIRDRLAALELSGEREAEIAEELGQHLEDRYADLRGRGQSEAEARAVVQGELADDALIHGLMTTERAAPEAQPSLAGQRSRARVLADLWHDLRYGARALRNAPGFTAVAVTTLALGIGATTAMFSVLNAVLIRPLPFPDPRSLVRVYQTNDQAEGGIGSLAVAEFLALRDDGRAFALIATYTIPRDGFSLVIADRAERIFGTIVGADFFSTLGVRPILGRAFQPGDDRPGAPATAVLSYAFWKGRLGGDPTVVGRQLTIQGGPVTVLGVMPPDVWYPRGEVAELWLNETFATPTRLGPWGWQAIARLRPGVGEAQRQQALTEVATRVRSQFPGGPAHWTFVERPLAEQFSGPVRPALLVLMGAVVLVLLIACVNVTNLMLARATGREHEIAVRTALGASRSRIVRQLLAESVLLASLGGVLGVALAIWGLRMLVAGAPDSLPVLRDLPVSVDHRVLAVAAGAALGSVLLFGLAPALLGGPARTTSSIRESGRGSTDGRSRRLLRSGLVGAEFAFSLVLLVGAGLLLRSLVKLRAVDTGLRVDGVVTGSIALPKARYGTPAAVLSFHDRLLGQIRSAPGIVGASASVGLPPDVFGNKSDFFVVGHPVAPGEFSPLADYLCVDGDFFVTMGIPLRAGRAFDTRDDANAPQTVIISAELARRFFGTGDPIGQRLSIGGSGPANEYGIVGVVGDVPYDGLAHGPTPALYFPFVQFSQGLARSFSVAIRTSGSPDEVSALLRTAVQGLDPELAVARVRTVRQLVDASVAGERFRTLLMALFAVIALVLAAVGIYGVMAFSVGRRAREIGVRIALGAGRGQIYRQILREGLAVAAIGIAIGLVAAVAASRVVSKLLFAVSATDALTFGSVPILLLVIAALASFVPARRAARVDPAITMVA